MRTSAPLGAPWPSSLLGAIAVGASGRRSGRPGAAGAGRRARAGPRAVPSTGCSSCHGAERRGVVTDGERRGPSLLESGEAAAYYYLSTGRMPLGRPRRAAAPQGAGVRRRRDRRARRVRGVARRRPAAARASTVEARRPGRGRRALPRRTARRATAPRARAAPSATAGRRRTARSRAAARSPPPCAPGPARCRCSARGRIDDEELGDVAAYVELPPATPTTRAACPLGRIGPIPEGFVAWLDRHDLAAAGAIGGRCIGTRVTSTGDDAMPREHRRERWPPACLRRQRGGAVALAVVYWRGGQPQLEGILLALASGGIGVGIVVVGQGVHAGDDEVVEEREHVASTRGRRASVRRRLRARARQALRPAPPARAPPAPRRVAALGAALLFPIRSLGPRPGRDLKRTPYGRGRAASSTRTATPLQADDLAVDGVLTVFPEGHVDAADSPTLLIRHPCRPGVRAARRPRGLDGRRGRRLLEAVHARGLPGRAVPGRRGAAAVPVPPVDLRRARRRPPGLRPGRPVAAPAAARRRRRRLPRRHRRLLRARSAPASGTATGDGGARC